MQPIEFLNITELQTNFEKACLASFFKICLGFKKAQSAVC